MVSMIKYIVKFKRLTMFLFTFYMLVFVFWQSVFLFLSKGFEEKFVFLIDQAMGIFYNKNPYYANQK